MLVAAKVKATATGGWTPDATARVEPEDTPYHVVTYELAFCGRCEGPFLIEITSYEVAGEFSAEQRRRVLFPNSRKMDVDGVPDHVARAYEQATRSFGAALYEPCVIMCRKCLEGICASLGASGHNLRNKLADLSKKNIIDSKLYKWADHLRAIGNDAAHDLSIIIEKDDARDAVDFVEAILLNVFSLNTKFDAFMKRHAARRSGGRIGDGTD